MTDLEPVRGKSFSLGLFGPKLSEQGLEDFLSPEDIAHFDRDDEAISRLHVRGLITHSQHVKARERLATKIRAAVRARAALTQPTAGDGQ